MRLQNFILHHVEERPIEKPLTQVIARQRPKNPEDVKIICQFSNGQRISAWVSPDVVAKIDRSAS